MVDKLVQEKNTFPEESWPTEFLTIPVYKNIPSHYKHTISTYKEMTVLKAALHDTVYEVPRKFLEQYRILDTVPYYYIKFLLERQPNTILDLGCGPNAFKPYIPGIIGMDPDKTCPADQFDYFDEEYAHGHTQAFDSVISINSIHFAPITDISRRLLWVANLCRPGYRGYVAFSIETWLMHTDYETVKKLFGPIPKWDHIVKYVNDQVESTGLNFCVSDWPAKYVVDNASIRNELNGDVRLVFEL